MKAFEADKLDIIKLFMKRLVTKGWTHQIEKVMQTVLFKIPGRFNKQRDACYLVFKGLNEAKMSSILNKQKDGQLLLNEAILKRDVSLVKELFHQFTLDLYQKDQAGKQC